MAPLALSFWLQAILALALLVLLVAGAWGLMALGRTWRSGAADFRGSLPEDALADADAPLDTDRPGVARRTLREHWLRALRDEQRSDR